MGKMTDLNQEDMRKYYEEKTRQLNNFFFERVSSDFEGEDANVALDNLTKIEIYASALTLCSIYSNTVVDDIYEENQQNYIDFCSEQLKVIMTDQIKNFKSQVKKENEEEK